MNDLHKNTDYNDTEMMAELRKRQQSRANIMAIILFALCVLFFCITLVKIGGW